MDSLSTLKPHACHLCDRSFKKKFNLKRHISTLHAEEQATTESDDESSRTETESVTD